MSVMAFIPARGGSKGIPNKNLVLLAGKPLIQYTIDAAQGSKSVSDIFISSDDPEIIDFCESLGVNIPYRRPPELAMDHSSIIDAVLHTLDWLQQNARIPENVILLQPTSPLRTADDIDGAIELFLKTSMDSLISVHRMIEHPYECLKLENGGWGYLVKPATQATRRQDYQEDFFYINGAIYLAKTELLMRERTFIVEGVTGLYFMNPASGVDIDDIFDLKRAAFYLKHVEEWRTI